jgi:hypothetical protein
MSIKIEIDEKEFFKSALAGNYASAYKTLADAERKLALLRFRLLHDALDGHIPSSKVSTGTYSSVFHKTGDHELSWDCPTSPIGTCVYNTYKYATDDCVFCHEPLERK